MLNEWREFLDYTRPVIYKADSKKDTVWLGRFTFEALREFVSVKFPHTLPESRGNEKMQ